MGVSFIRDFLRAPAAITQKEHGYLALQCILSIWFFRSPALVAAITKLWRAVYGRFLQRIFEVGNTQDY